jgi:NAD(P)H-hydrate epimerase
MLMHRGFDVQIVMLSAPDDIDGDAGTNLDIAMELGIPLEDLSDLDPDEIHGALDDIRAERTRGIDVWIDAMLGTGLDGEVRGRYRPAIEWLNRRARIFSVDIPSGISGATGRPMGVAVDADATATLGGAKLGQALLPGRQHCGRLHIIDIGIPPTAYRRVSPSASWLDQNWARGHTRTRPTSAHKGSTGRVLVVGGSHQKTGAALLCARGALHGGAGLITVGTTEPVVPRIATSVHEVMAEELVGTTADPNHEEGLRSFLEQVDTVAIGPGLNTHDGARQAVEVVLDSDCDAAILDADALNVLAHDVSASGEPGTVSAPLFDALERFTAEHAAILTPHPGEMARLRGVETGEVLASPVEHARTLAEQTGAVVVLKQADTLIAAPDGRLAVNSSGNPGMASGGTGDVLTGLIGAQASGDLFNSTGEHHPRGLDAFEAAALSVWVHGAAGDLLAEETGHHGLTAGRLADTLPTVWSKLEAPPGGTGR